jgi:hypothetical protein
LKRLPLALRPHHRLHPSKMAAVPVYVCVSNEEKKWNASIKQNTHHVIIFKYKHDIHLVSSLLLERQLLIRDD